MVARRETAPIRKYYCFRGSRGGQSTHPICNLGTTGPRNDAWEQRSNDVLRQIPLIGVVACFTAAAMASEPVIWVEGEEAVKKQLVDNAGLNDVNPDELSGGKWICSFSHEKEPTGTAEYAVEITQGRPLPPLGAGRWRHRTGLSRGRREGRRGRGHRQGDRTRFPSPPTATRSILRRQPGTTWARWT